MTLPNNPNAIDIQKAIRALEQGGASCGVHTLEEYASLYLSSSDVYPQFWFQSVNEDPGHLLLVGHVPMAPPSMVFIEGMTSQQVGDDETYNISTYMYGGGLPNVAELIFELLIPPSPAEENDNSEAYTDCIEFLMGSGSTGNGSDGETCGFVMTDEGNAGSNGLEPLHILNGPMPVLMPGHFTVRLRPQLAFGRCEVDVMRVYQPFAVYRLMPIVHRSHGMYFWNLNGDYEYPYPAFELITHERPYPEGTRMTVSVILKERTDY